jgi:F-type H+-transporting ATPase subunit a
MYKIFLSPLEQFEVYPIISIYLGNIDFSITNHTLTLLIIFFFLYVFISSLTNTQKKSLLIIPSKPQAALELIYIAVLKIVFDNIPRKKGQYFFPFIFSIFFFILCLNLIGLIPYSSTLTAQFIVTFTIALVVFLGINIICVRLHGISFFTIFLPAGSEGALALILVPIEFISYFFKPISLSLRLFANMMAGHTLLKIIAGICWSLAGCTGILFLMQYVPMLILVFLVILELAIALIQAIVFSTLVSTYIHDVIFLH